MTKYVMLHGLGQTARSWSETVSAMERCGGRFDVMLPEITEFLRNKTPLDKSKKVCYNTKYT